jgi:excisionase family DNA binding protein
MPDPKTPPRLMTVARAAAALDCHPETVRRAIRSGRLACYRMRGCTRISPEHLQAYLDASFHPAKSADDEPVATLGARSGVRDVAGQFRLERRMRAALSKSG